MTSKLIEELLKMDAKSLIEKLCEPIDYSKLRKDIIIQILGDTDIRRKIKERGIDINDPEGFKLFLSLIGVGSVAFEFVASLPRIANALERIAKAQERMATLFEHPDSLSLDEVEDHDS